MSIYNDIRCYLLAIIFKSFRVKFVTQWHFSTELAAFFYRFFCAFVAKEIWKTTLQQCARINSNSTDALSLLRNPERVTHLILSGWWRCSGLRLTAHAYADNLAI